MEKEGRIEIESWSLYSLEQRLMAGALGVGFMPTKSLMESSLAEENADSFKVIGNPFDERETIGVVKSLVPDISIIHGCAADLEGNIILSPPYFASIWGPRASKGGVIATVEEIVSSEFMRRHSTLVKVPGYLVKFVCPVPFGAHPQGLAAESIGVEGGYGEDYEFIISFVEASHDSSRLKEWIEEWIIQCPTQKHYLRKLGAERIMSLKGKSNPDDWEYETLECDPGQTTRTDFNSTEMMVVGAAREIKEIVLQRDYQTLLSGIGSPGLAAWLAFYLLKKGDHHIDLMTGTGQVGLAPRPGDPFLMSLSNVMTCEMLTDTVELYGTFVGGANNRCLSVIGTAQIDQNGYINTSKMGDLYFIGVGGAGDAINASEAIVVTKQSRERLVEKVRFVSCSGQRIKTLVTDLGVFKKLEGEKSFTLTKYFTVPSMQGEDRLREITERCGWKVKVGKDLEKASPPTSEELAILRSIDPKGLFIGEISK
jgi:acyl CoA:acetate/3-ketoacid CoA transferase beta subunit